MRSRFFQVVLFLTLFGCSNEDEVLAPAIASINPASGPYNTLVEINGSNFSNQPAENVVKFNGLVAEVVNASATQLTAKVPKGAMTGELTVTTNGLSSTGQVFVFEYTFTVTASTVAGTTQGFADGAANAAQFNFPAGLVVDNQGNILVADRRNFRIRKISPSGIVSTYAGSTSGSIDGDISVATFRPTNSLFYDKTGNLIVIEDSRIRKISPMGMVSTIAGGTTLGFADGNGAAAQFNFNTMGCVDSKGNFFIADFVNNRIRKITSNGDVTTFAGDGTAASTNGTGTSAQLNAPWGVAIDKNDDLYVSEFWGSRVRKITSAGVVTTVAGSSAGYVDGPIASAKFGNLRGIALDANHNIYLSDGSYVRLISSTGTVSTIVGLPTPGYADGGREVAKFDIPYPIVITSDGHLLIGELNNFKVRKILLE